MISNERQWPHLRPTQHQRRDYRQQFRYAPEPQHPLVQEDTLKVVEVQVEQKFFTLTLKENQKGRFLRITEEVRGRRNTIIVPASGLQDFQKLLDEMVKAANEIPAMESEPSPQ